MERTESELRLPIVCLDLGQWGSRFDMLDPGGDLFLVQSLIDTVSVREKRLLLVMID